MRGFNTCTGSECARYLHCDYWTNEWGSQFYGCLYLTQYAPGPGESGGGGIHPVVLLALVCGGVVLFCMFMEALTQGSSDSAPSTLQQSQQLVQNLRRETAQIQQRTQHLQIEAQQADAEVIRQRAMWEASRARERLRRTGG